MPLMVWLGCVSRFKKLMDQVCGNESQSFDLYLKTYHFFFWDMVVPSLGKTVRASVSVGLVWVPIQTR